MNKFFPITLLSLSICSCQNEEPSPSLQEIILSTEWTQQTGFLDDSTFFSAIQTFNKVTFQENGNCIIVLNTFGVPVDESPNTRTITLPYEVVDEQILFPEPFGQVSFISSEDTTTVDAFISDWELVEMDDEFIRFRSINGEVKSEGFVIDVPQFFMEPCE